MITFAAMVKMVIEMASVFIDLALLLRGGGYRWIARRVRIKRVFAKAGVVICAQLPLGGITCSHLRGANREIKENGDSPDSPPVEKKMAAFSLDGTSPLGDLANRKPRSVEIVFCPFALAIKRNRGLPPLRLLKCPRFPARRHLMARTCFVRANRAWTHGGDFYPSLSFPS
ncbi:MAG: hypothetical protein ACLP9L_20235 [Thermoguttaceae bacterium]